METGQPDNSASQNSEPQAQELLEIVVQELLAGRSKRGLRQDLQQRNWDARAAQKFVDLAFQIAVKRNRSPEKRGELAHRGWDQMQQAWLWVVLGLVAANVAYNMVGPSVPFYVSLLVFIWGMVELLGGLIRWLPHREHYHAAPKPGTDSKSAEKSPLSPGAGKGPGPGK